MQSSTKLSKFFSSSLELSSYYETESECLVSDPVFFRSGDLQVGCCHQVQLL